LWSKNYDPFDAKKLKEEIADAFVLLAALAHEFDIDIEQAVREKFIEKDRLFFCRSNTKIHAEQIEIVPRQGYEALRRVGLTLVPVTKNLAKVQA
jgi:NTP pyrophosphatase (non-canonical NTP hydrolase)